MFPEGTPSPPLQEKAFHVSPALRSTYAAHIRLNTKKRHCLALEAIAGRRHPMVWYCS